MRRDTELPKVVVQEEIFFFDPIKTLHPNEKDMLYCTVILLLVSIPDGVVDVLCPGDLFVAEYLALEGVEPDLVLVTQDTVTYIYQDPLFSFTST